MGETSQRAVDASPDRHVPLSSTVPFELVSRIGEEVGDVNRAAQRFSHAHCAVESRSTLVGSSWSLPSTPGQIREVRRRLCCTGEVVTHRAPTITIMMAASALVNRTLRSGLTVLSVAAKQFLSHGANLSRVNAQICGGRRGLQ